MSTPRAILLVLAKAPVPGQVKTRLCPPLTPTQAARIAAAALLDTLDAVLAVPQTAAVVALAGRLDRVADPAPLHAALQAASVIRQRGSTLGERIAAAHAAAAALAPGTPVLQIGMDTPQADARLLGHCLDILDRPGTDAGTGTDAALGLARDGGWWALGLRDPALAGLIAAVPTSRPDTGTTTLATLRAAGCHVAELPQLSDVDTADDAVAVAAGVPASRFGTAVRAALAPTAEGVR
ncbi:MAG: TIGR04282 family arsenosugar biosynthesis glycosyltransferase [Pseudonocardiaceae bacterium]